MAKLSKGRKKKQVIHTPKTLDERYIGTEPEWDDEEPSKMDIMHAYSWYNYFYTSKDAAALLYNNLDDKKKVRELKKIPHEQLPNTICYQAAMLARGCKLDKARFNSKIDELLQFTRKFKQEVKQQKKVVEKPSIQDRIREQISDYIGEIEDELDTFTTSKYKSDFNMYEWLRSKNVKSTQSNAIAQYYKPVLEELEAANDDEDLKEAYSYMKTAEMTRFIEFVRMLVDDAETWGSNQKTVRKTRTKKPASVEKQLKSLKYAKENKEFKLVSVNPATILGAQQLWVFNTKYRKLTKFDAASTGGFTIKGTTLQGWDETTAITKRVRKPEDVLPRVLNGGKRVLNKIFDEINSKVADANGRINADTILLKVVK